MVLEASPVKSASATSETTNAATPKTPPATKNGAGKAAGAVGAMKSTTPNARSTPRRSVGGGDADASKDGSEDLVHDRSTGDESNCSSGSGGSVVGQRVLGPRGEEELASRSITIQSKRSADVRSLDLDLLIFIDHFCVIIKKILGHLIINGENEIDSSFQVLFGRQTESPRKIFQDCGR